MLRTGRDVKTKRFLVVEDDELDFAYVEHCLRVSVSDPVEIIWASDVETARQHLKSQSFDLVILDYHLGNRTPGALVQYLRNEDRDIAKDVPVMVLSSVHPHLLEPFLEALDRSVFVQKTEMNLAAFRISISALGVTAH